MNSVAGQPEFESPELSSLDEYQNDFYHSDICPGITIFSNESPKFYAGRLNRSWECTYCILYHVTWSCRKARTSNWHLTLLVQVSLGFLQRITIKEGINGKRYFPCKGMQFCTALLVSAVEIWWALGWLVLKWLDNLQSWRSMSLCLINIKNAKYSPSSAQLYYELLVGASPPTCDHHPTCVNIS